MKAFLNTERLTYLAVIILFAASVIIGGYSCKYGRKNGGAVFFACDDCVQTQNLYVYVDGKKISGSLEKNMYNIVCGPGCDPKDSSPSYPNYSGTEGEHIYELRDISGKVFQTESFNIIRNKCTEVQVLPLGCLSASGSSTGNSNSGTSNNTMPSNFDNQGTIIVKSTSLKICARDWDVVDGDKITIVVNGSTIASNVDMTETNKCWNLTLASGQNWIGIICNSPGTTAAASPGIEINDGKSTQTFKILSYPDTPGGYIIKVEL